MKLVIDVPNYNLDKVQNGSIACSRILKAVKNGTPLPKGHGRLIDADDVKKNHKKWIGYIDEDMIARLNIAVDKHVPTIIEADKGEEE